MSPEQMKEALKALISCMGTEAKDPDVYEVAEEYEVNAARLLTLYKTLAKDLELWLEGKIR